MTHPTRRSILLCAVCMLFFSTLLSAQELELFQDSYGLYGFKDSSDHIVIPAKYNYADSFSEGLAPVEIEGKWGFIDKSGKFVIPAKYDNLSYVSMVHFDMGSGYFPEGLLGAEINGKWGFINRRGKLIIPAKYDSVEDFSDGRAEVKIDNNYLYIDRFGREYKHTQDGVKAIENMFNQPFPQLLASTIGTYDNFLRKEGITPLTKEAVTTQVQAEVDTWQKKGEFESTAKWQERVNDSTRKAKALEIAERITNEYNAKTQNIRTDYETQYQDLIMAYCTYKTSKFNEQSFTLMPYDADNETFMIKTNNIGDILLPVPADEAPAFKSNWENIKWTAEAVYVPVGNDVALQSVRFGDYVYDSNTKADYAMTDVDYNFKPLDLSTIDYNFAPIADGGAATTVATTPGKTVQPKTVQPEVRYVQGGTLADVDANIPQGSQKAENTFAIIIANGTYEHASPVATAANDGAVMEKYLTRTLGLPQNNVTTYIDATYGRITSAVGYLQDIAAAYGKDNFNVIFYYVGHGLPDDATKEAYMLPVDVDPRKTNACYPLSRLYQELADLNAANVMVMIDACFSGSNYGDGMLVGQSMGARIKAKGAAPMGKMVVLTASQGDETAFPYEEKGHGLFTYYILKKLQESQGNLTLGELSEYVTDHVRKTSVTVNRKPQTPSVAVSPEISTSWRSLPFGK